MDLSNINKINSVPNTYFKECLFRGKNKSEDHNEFLNNIINDIVDLFNKASNIENNVNSITENVMLENNMLIEDNKILTNKITELNQIINNYSIYNNKINYIYPRNIENDMYFKSIIDNRKSCITVNHFSSCSKVNVLDESTNSTFVPKSLKYGITINPNGQKNNDDILSMEENEFANCFNNDLSDFYYNKVTTNNNVDYINAEVIITLPEDIISTRNINEINVDLTPFKGPVINKISHRLGNGFWCEIEELKDLETYNNGINENFKLNFSKIQCNQLKIDLTLNKYTNINDSKVFYFGFKNIDIKENNYNNYSLFNFTHEFKEKNTIIINNIEAIYNNKKSLSGNLIQFEYYYVDNNDIKHKIVDSLPFVMPTNKLFVKCKLYNNEDSTPNISKIEINYKNM